jgi:hypothetical protein
MKPVLLVLCILSVVACNSEKKLRNDECGQFADWSNKSGDALGTAVPDSEKAAADTNEKRAAVHRKLAEGARKSAKTSIPFKDAHVRGLATRHLAAFDEIALALDHQASAWEKGDGEEQKKAIQEEMTAKGKQVAVSKEWLSGCRL